MDARRGWVGGWHRVLRVRVRVCVCVCLVASVCLVVPLAFPLHRARKRALIGTSLTRVIARLMGRLVLLRLTSPVCVVLVVAVLAGRWCGNPESCWDPPQEGHQSPEQQSGGGTAADGRGLCCQEDPGVLPPQTQDSAAKARVAADDATDWLLLVDEASFYCYYLK